MTVTCEKLSRMPFAIINMLLAIGVLTCGFGVTVAAGYYNTDRFLNSPGPLREYSDSIVLCMLIGGLLMIIASLLGIALIRLR